MSQAEDLLNELSEDDVGVDSNSHIVIGSDRFWVVPEDVKKIAVQYDHNIETITFDCPRYWDGHDMSKMRVYVNYMRADDEKGGDLATNIVVDEVDETIMHFNWTITGHLSAVPGPVVALVCVKAVGEDGSEKNHWNSELNTDLYVSEGLESETTVNSHYPGIVTSLLARMDAVENKTTREAMLGYVETYLTETSPNWLEEFFVSETVLDLVRGYMNENGVKDGTKIIISNEKPDRECIWFNVTSVVDEYVNYGLRITDPDTGKEYRLHIVDGKLTMTEIIE